VGRAGHCTASRLVPHTLSVKSTRMKYFVAILIFVTGLGSGYILGQKKGNESLEDFALLNVLSGIALAHYLEKGEYGEVKDLSYINVGENLDIAMDKDGSTTSPEFIAAKTRAMNALYLRWEIDPPKYWDNFTDEDLKSWSTERHNQHMRYLKLSREACVKNEELKCKSS